MKTEGVSGVSAVDLLSEVEWTPVDWSSGEPDGDLPYATHRGELKIGPVSIQCAQLSDGRRVITENGLGKFLGFLEGTGGVE